MYMKNIRMFVRQVVKFYIVIFVDMFAHIRGFAFPDSFIWYWKLDILLNRYEPETTRLFQKTIKPGMTVIDVGANIGYYTRLLSGLVGPTGKVYAFEPDEENWDFLVRNTKEYPNIHILKQAVSDHSGEIHFYHVRGSTGTHSILPTDDAELRTVESVSIDDFLRQNGIERLHAIKIDVEGAEEGVFQGMAGVLNSPHAPMVVFEYTPDTSKEFVASLGRRYDVRAISHDGLLVPFSDIQYKMGKREYANVVIGTI
jgi:FkbM family methyltransferase